MDLSHMHDLEISGIDHLESICIRDKDLITKVLKYIDSQFNGDVEVFQIWNFHLKTHISSNMCC